MIDAVLTHRGGLRVFAGTGCAALPDTIDLSRYALERGADAVMIVPPFYFKGVDDAGLINYYAALLHTLPRERSVILYNIPSVSAVEFTDGLVDGLLEHYADRLLGINDTSGDIERTRRYINRYPQLAVYNGNDDGLAGAAELDVSGAISAVANVFPDLIAWVFRTHETKGDVAGSQAEVAQVRELLARFPLHSAIKHLLHLIAGLPLTHVRPPLRDLTADEASALARAVESLPFA